MTSVLSFLTYVAVLLLLGASLFPIYSGQTQPERHTLAVEVRPVFFTAALLIAASGIGALAVAVAHSGLEAVLRPGASAFLNAWGLRLAAAAIVTVLQLGRMAAWRLFACVFVSLVLLADVVWSGHAGSDVSATARPHVLFDAFHVIAAGAWFGALCCFAGFSLVRGQSSTPEALRRYHDALARFSGVGPAVIATLILSGIFLIGLQKISSESTGAYNRVLLAKLVMFASMLLLAAANRFWLTPRLWAALDSKQDLAIAVRALRVSLLAETGLGVLVLAAATWLGTFPAP